MTTSRPPALALALLNRLSSADDDLAGDLVEEFEARPSRLWFWRQVLTALVLAPFRPSRDPRPLHLVDDADRGAFESRQPERRFDRRTINLTASPLPGIGGLGLAMLIALAILVQPRLWLVALAVAAAGVLLGAGLIVFHRHHGR